MFFFARLQISTIRIYYGDRVHYLCTKASAPEIRKIMDSMCQVVQAMLKRVHADLAEDEIAVSLQAFNLETWQKQNQHRMLKSCFLKLCKLFGGEDRNAVHSLAAAAKVLAQVFQASKRHDVDVTNRIAWSWVLCPRWRSLYMSKTPWSPQCQQVVEFYIALKLNTTSLERDLGELLAQLSAHSGPLSSCGSTIAAILEVSLDGPKTEADFFLPSERPGGPLVPTDFARLCQGLWRQHFGRRFRFVYRKKGSEDGQLPGKNRLGHKAHNPKSLAGRLSGRFQAATAAAARTGSHESFVPGIQLPLPKPMPSLPGTRWASTSSSAAEMALENFEKHTLRKTQRT